MGEDVNDSTDEATTTEQRIVYNKGVKKRRSKKKGKREKKGRKEKRRESCRWKKGETQSERGRGREGGRVSFESGLV